MLYLLGLQYIEPETPEDLRTADHFSAKPFNSIRIAPAHAALAIMPHICHFSEPLGAGERARQEEIFLR